MTPRAPRDKTTNQRVHMEEPMAPAAYVTEVTLWDINGRRVSWSCEGSMPQCRGMSGQGIGSEWMGEQGDRGWDRGFWRGNKKGDNIILRTLMHLSLETNNVTCIECV